MRIGLDVWGGDYAPVVTVEGAIQAYEHLLPDARLVLFGDEDGIRKICKEKNFDADNFDIVHTPETIHMHEHPAKAFASKTNSSIYVGFQHLSTKKIDAFASAGSTGAMMVGTMLTIKPIPGILRPGIAIGVPRIDCKKNLLIDVGLNADCKPENLVQYAFLGSLYSKYVYKVDNPRVGLLNIGSEKEKGNLISKATYPLLEAQEDINFIGNIEGGDIYFDKADVIVCDGFVGNVLLKASESFADIARIRKIDDPVLDAFNPDNYGGTPVLGIDANVIIGHGASNNRAIKNMILHAQSVITVDLPSKIKQHFTTVNE